MINEGGYQDEVTVTFTVVVRVALSLVAVTVME
jgi:hypothetical protein